MVSCCQSRKSTRGRSSSAARHSSRVKYTTSLVLYFPVKRVVFMPPRACHSVPLFLAAVCGGRERPSASAQWGRAFCGVAQAAPPSLHNALRPGAAGVCLTSASVLDPRSPWAAPGWVAATYVKMAPATKASSGNRFPTFWGKDKLARRSQHLFGRQRQPFDRPAIAIEGLRSAPVNGSEVFNRSGSSKRGSWMSAVLKVGAPGRASVQIKSSQNAACSDREVGPRRSCQVSWRSGGVAAIVRPL